MKSVRRTEIVKINPIETTERWEHLIFEADPSAKYNVSFWYYRWVAEVENGPINLCSIVARHSDLFFSSSMFVVESKEQFEIQKKSTCEFLIKHGIRKLKNILSQYEQMDEKIKSGDLEINII